MLDAGVPKRMGPALASLSDAFMGIILTSLILIQLIKSGKLKFLLRFIYLLG
jgi:hypothetical protein